MATQQGIRLTVYGVLDALTSLRARLQCADAHPVALSREQARDACVTIENSIEELRRVASGLSSAGVAD